MKTARDVADTRYWWIRDHAPGADEAIRALTDDIEAYAQERERAAIERCMAAARNSLGGPTIDLNGVDAGVLHGWCEAVSAIRALLDER